MSQFKRILVALDFTELDETLLAYTLYLSRTLPLQKIYFVHVSSQLEPLKDLEEELGGVPHDELIREKLREEVMRHFKDSDISISCEVIEGTPPDILLKWVDIKGIDLLVVGRKDKRMGSGVTAKKLARQVNCSVLFVPQYIAAITNVLIPLDFSKYSAELLKTGLDIGAQTSAQITCQHVFEMPINFYVKLFQTSDKLRAKAREKAKTNFAAFLEEHHVDQAQVKSVFNSDETKSPSRHINRYAESSGADLIVVGAKGAANLENFLIGDVTEQLITYIHSIALLIVKATPDKN